MKQGIELAEIMREAAESGTLKASKEQWEVVNAIINCRTASLGGHLYRCGDCGEEQPRYNSCRNRHCPKCQGGDIAKWLEKRQEELLPVPYFHVVFTIPHELNGFVLQNKRLMLNLLFQAVSKTLKEVSKRRLGGEIGFFAVLHTWGQLLELHPHIHCVIPGVIIKADGTAEKMSEKYFLPQRILSTVFRAIFCKMFKKAQKKLALHGQQKEFTEKAKVDKLMQKLFSKDWVVYAKEPFAGPQAVLKYLARYTHRVAISNSRIVSSADGQTTFSYKDYADDCRRKESSLPTPEFLRRFLLHVVPKQFVRIRYFGFMASALRAKALAMLKKTFTAVPASALPSRQRICCPSCGSDALQRVAELAPQRTITLASSRKAAQKGQTLTNTYLNLHPNSGYHSP